MRAVLKMTKAVSVELQKGTSQDELANKLEELAKHIRGVKKSGGCLSAIEVNIEGSRWVRIPFDGKTGTLSDTVTISVYSEKERVTETNSPPSPEEGQPGEGNQKKKGGGRKKN